MIDAYTKAVLTVIALALVALVVRPTVEPSPASAQAPAGPCGKPSTPCFVATAPWTRSSSRRRPDFPSRCAHQVFPRFMFRSAHQIDPLPAREAHGRQAPRHVLLDGRGDPPAAPLKVPDESLPIAVDEYREIGVARQSRLGADRHGQAADQRELAAELPEVRDDAAEGGFGAAQGRDGGQEMGRPQPSPCSAPGRVSSQATSRASISSSVASGCSRWSCARRIDSPSAQRSKAVRSRAASASGESSATGSL
jgi:hypothetical protein